MLAEHPDGHAVVAFRLLAIEIAFDPAANFLDGSIVVDSVDKSQTGSSFGEYFSESPASMVQCLRSLI